MYIHVYMYIYIYLYLCFKAHLEKSAAEKAAYRAWRAALGVNNPKAAAAGKRPKRAGGRVAGKKTKFEDRVGVTGAVDPF